MKKLLAACICFCFTFSMAGCSLGTVIDRFVSAGDSSAQETVPDKTRVYMDEVQGVLRNFTGNEITVRVGKTVYHFDVSQATLECENGMITGDKVSVIYEGRLNDTDTSGVKALKVVDQFHQKTELKESSATGEVLDFTLNTITVRTDQGNTITFPITGTRQYYQNGIQQGSSVCLHYKGVFPAVTDENPDKYNASHLKVLSVSDVEPFEAPAPTPTPVPAAAENGSAGQEKTLYCVISDVKLSTLQAVIEGTETALTFQMSALPCYFPGGLAEGAHITVAYTGEFNGTTLDGLTLLNITGENPASEKDSHISFRVTGSIVGTTANTLTIQTNDHAAITFNKDNALNASTGGLSEGCGVRITFNPAASDNSNIYPCLRIEDA